MPYHDPSDELFRQFLSGDENAFQQLFPYFFKIAYPCASHLVKDDMVAEDIACEAIYKLWKNVVKLTSKDHVVAYLLKIVGNDCNTYFEKTTTRNKREKD